MFKTKFEKFTKKVISWLKRFGVNTESRMGSIMDLMTDYFDVQAQEPDVDPRYAAQCIKFELTRDFGSERANMRGIRESVGSDLDDFIDAVLDEIGDMDYQAYRYYNTRRETVMDMIEKGMDEIEVAQKCVNFFEEGEDWEEIAEEEERAWNRFEEEYGNEPPENPGDRYAELRDLRHSKKYLDSPAGSDGIYATKKDPISYAIANNDVVSLEKYYKNGVPLKLITGDSFDTETIPFMDQYAEEFHKDYRLLTEHTGKSIDDALKFMLYEVEEIDNFAVSPFDLYNLFVSDKCKDDIIYALIFDMEVSYKGKEVPYFNVNYEDLEKYANAWF